MLHRVAMQFRAAGYAGRWAFTNQRGIMEKFNIYYAVLSGCIRLSSF